jgi:hypothetical protein
MTVVPGRGRYNLDETKRLCRRGQKMVKNGVQLQTETQQLLSFLLARVHAARRTVIEHGHRMFGPPISTVDMSDQS